MVYCRILRWPPFLNAFLSIFCILYSYTNINRNIYIFFNIFQLRLWYFYHKNILKYFFWYFKVRIWFFTAFKNNFTCLNFRLISSLFWILFRKFLQTLFIRLQSSSRIFKFFNSNWYFHTLLFEVRLFFRYPLFFGIFLHSH